MATPTSSEHIYFDLYELARAMGLEKSDLVDQLVVVALTDIFDDAKKMSFTEEFGRRPTRKEMKGAQPEQQHVVAAIRKRLKGGV